MTPRVRLSAETHRVYELDDGLLLVFKPALHAEPTHVHSYAQRLRVLRGRLEVRVDGETLLLDASSAPLSLAAGQAHATAALEATWLIAEGEAGAAGGRHDEQ